MEKVSSVSAGTCESIWLPNLNDPRPGGCTNPKEQVGVCIRWYQSHIMFASLQQSVDNKEDYGRKSVVLSVAEQANQTARWVEREGPIAFLRQRRRKWLLKARSKVEQKKTCWQPNYHLASSIF